ncbi:biotin/lipoate A/B protein ligase family protein [Roseofilum sp. BLCC_M154]|uniref:Biotin/lipoate A/B protein ligase family protein n=1 Tax=Roseofilum acuticapitatum BLCC-M154 TaxID=3022444 RepID=A0ABT7ATH0_9CYAN|nr:biotin/lipoate A/B protein ligase family protein [Roseofilum acuticapitatum BLCC-M154]
MAIDRWLWKQHQQGHQPPSLRFYTWKPVAISLGYHQKRWPESWQGLQWQGKPIELVRRPTGGRGVLHQGDLTYAVVYSGRFTNRVAAYQKICEFLIRGWRSLGFELHYGSAGRGYAQVPNCFATATGADLVLDSGYKLIGSAQVWQSKTVLQHGSMRLNGDRQLWHQIFSESIPEPPPSLADLSFSHLVHTFTQAARETFEIEMQIQPLSAQEWAEIRAQPTLK